MPLFTRTHCLIWSKLSGVVKVYFQFNDLRGQQITFPVRYGGLEIHSARHLAFPSYLVSVHSCADFLSQIREGPNLTASAQNTVGKWSERFGIEIIPASLRKY